MSKEFKKANKKMEKHFVDARAIPALIVEAAILGNTKPLEVYVKLNKINIETSIIIQKEHNQYYYIYLGHQSKLILPHEEWIIYGKVMAHKALCKHIKSKKEQSNG